MNDQKQPEAPYPRAPALWDRAPYHEKWFEVQPTA